MSRILRGLAALVGIAIVIGSANTAGAVDYLRVCSLYGPGFYYVPGTGVCVQAGNKGAVGETREQTDQGTVRKLNSGDLAFQGVAMAMAMPSPYIEPGKHFAIAGNIAYFEGASAVAFAGAFRAAHNLSFSASVAYGLEQQVLATRFGVNVIPGAGPLGEADPDDQLHGPDFDGVFAVNASIFTGLLADYFDLGPNLSSQQNGVQVGGLARVRVALHPLAALQFDGWTDVGFYSRDPTVTAPGNELPTARATGAAVHATLTPGDNMFGVFGSMGGRNFSRQYATYGLEWLRSMGDHVGYLQGGVTGPMGETRRDKHAIYGHGALRYFPFPNLMIEANAGAAYFDKDELVTAWLYRWGVKAEMKLEGRNVSIFGQYEGNYLDRGMPSNGTLQENVVQAGVRFLVNEGPTLRDGAVKGASLLDYNPLYGQFHSRMQ